MSNTHTEMSAFESAYLRKVNTFGFLFLLLHVPVLCGIAYAKEGGTPGIVLLIMVLLLAGPAAMLWSDRSSQSACLALAVSAMGVSALTIHVSGGMIEAHFELFTIIAMLTIFGRVAPLLVAATIIALHHVIFWIWLPSSVFNYKASFAIVLIHAFFVVFEVIPACWIAQQFGRAIQSQGLVVDHLGDMVRQVTVAAAEVSGASHSLAQGAAQQAASIQETSAAASEINSIAARNTTNSAAAATMVQEAALRFDTTSRSLDAVVEAMQGIDDSSQQVSRIIKVIDQIAFQTNILALNAAVEAARAGEAGAGFAVVADEVRSLSHRCSKAAQDTSSLIEASLGKTRSGTSMVDLVATEFRSLALDSSRMKLIVDEIRLASQQQAEGTQQIARSLTTIEQITQSNAANSEQTSAASEELTAQASSIHAIVKRLELLARSGSSTSHSAAPSHILEATA